jgi:hypothetical protein
MLIDTGAERSMNSRILMQCSKEPQPEYVVEKLMSNFPGWEYQHYDDQSMLDYIRSNPIEEFPSADERMLYYYAGSHRADFFRYFFLYQNGGAYIDSDLMIEKNIQEDIDFYDMVTVRNSVMPAIFQGFFICDRYNTVVYEALKDMYYLKNDQSALEDDYQAICKNMFIILNKDKNYSKKIYNERYVKYFNEAGEKMECALIMDNNEVIGAHYYEDKIIPKTFMNEGFADRIIRYL